MAVLPDNLAAMSPGPGLAAALGAVELSAVSNDRMLDVLAAQQRQLSHEQARMAATLAEPTLSGTVDIALAEQATGEMCVVEHAKAFTNGGLEGDRYAAKAGTFTPANDTIRGHDLTLIEAEVLDSLSLPDGNRIAYADARRNIVTRGIDLNALVGRRFRIGNVECLGQRLCEPCSHLERLTIKGTLRALIHRGGLRADVLSDGEITTGAPIATLG
ncbi:MAG: hypothetical protein L0I24_15675 [Pseudonocardia sp.]|nr:hypothetical protein [Pseudonocardia sp.]